MIGVADASPYLPDDRRRWLRARPPGEPVIVATAGESVIGWSALGAHSSRSAYAHVKDLSVYVRRDRRAQGVGALLLAELFSRGVRAGVAKVVLTAFPFNENGLALFRRFGFRLVGTYERHAVIGGRWFDVVIMELRLLG
jgi:phosphinothricin acetyltransferase